MTSVPTPWSKRHKVTTRASSGGLTHGCLSNSFAEPLTSGELLDLTAKRGDHDLLNEYRDHSLRYTPNGGSLDLRTEIAKLYGPDISSENVLVFPGAQVALQTAMRAVVGDDRSGGGGGGHSITFGPGYQSVTEGPLHAGGGDVTKIALRPENGWQIDVDEVRDVIRESDTRLLVINQPHNPSGTLMKREELEELIAVAKDVGAHVLSDEVYRLLEHDESDRLPAVADLYERGLSCVTLSKPWGACGVTIGWIATRDVELLDRMSDVQYFGTACPSRASELQAIMVLRSSDYILSRNIDIIRRNKVLLEDFMGDYPDLFDWVPPRAGAIAAIRFMGPLTSTELGDDLAGAGISIKPAYCFVDADSIDGGNDYFRVGFGESVMPSALDALRRFVDERKEGWRSEISKSP